MTATKRSGFEVSLHAGAAGSLPGALEVDVGSDLPVAFDGLRALLDALGERAPQHLDAMREGYAAEWNVLFPRRHVDGPDLLAIADAPNQRRLFRESEQVFRVLRAAARTVVDALRDLDAPLVLRNTGACDLVSLRGLMYAGQLAALDGVRAEVSLGEWDAAPAFAARSFAASGRELRSRVAARLGASPRAGSRDAACVSTAGRRSTVEGSHLALAVRADAPPVQRMAAALLALRACFFSTHYEGAALAADTALDLLDASSTAWTPSALLAAWDALADDRFDVPMLEIDRAHLAEGTGLRALVLTHRGVAQAFAGFGEAANASFEAALAVAPSPEIAADLHLYRALVALKGRGDLASAESEVAAGLACLAGRPRDVAALHAAWLHNLEALVHFRRNDLDAAHLAEERSMASIDGVPGASAVHLKTNLVSNFSVLYERRGDHDTALRIWDTFAALNAKVRSDALDKVHLHRRGALLRGRGDVDEGLALLRGAREKALATGDVFHAEVLAGSIARTHLDRGEGSDRAEAATWYRLAAEGARACGDCVRLAQDLAGVALAEGTTNLDEARAVLPLDRTHPRTVLDPLAAALDDGSPAALRAAMPRPQTKLGRPFVLVTV